MLAQEQINFKQKQMKKTLFSSVLTLGLAVLGASNAAAQENPNPSQCDPANFVIDAAGKNQTVPAGTKLDQLKPVTGNISGLVTDPASGQITLDWDVTQNTTGNAFGENQMSASIQEGNLKVTFVGKESLGPGVIKLMLKGKYDPQRCNDTVTITVTPPASQAGDTVPVQDVPAVANMNGDDSVLPASNGAEAIEKKSGWSGFLVFLIIVLALAFAGFFGYKRIKAVGGVDYLKNR